jgi:glycosyltransferase involved in cell wall biosynthesis
VPNVSVIVCCYNADRFVEESLRSVREQTYKDYELILVNDGSTDGTHDALLKAQGESPSNTRSVSRRVNGGLPAARNSGKDAAAGRFHLYLDADDLLPPTALEDHLKAIEGAEVSYSGFERFTDDPAQTSGRFEKLLPAEDTLATLLVAGTDADSWWVPPGAVMVRSAFAHDISWGHHVPITNDLHYYACLLHKGAKFVSTGAIGLKYRMHDKSLSRSNPLGLCAESLWLADHWIEKVGPLPKLVQRKRETLGFMRSYANIELETMLAARSV